MADRIEGNKRGGKRPAEAPRAAAETFASPIHELLRMTPQEVEADILSRGKTPAGVARAFGRMEKKVRAEFGEIARDREVGVGAALLRDFRMDSATLSRSEQAGAARMLAAADLLDARHKGPVAMARAVGAEEEGDWQGDGQLVMIDTASQPRDGDMVLAHVEDEGQVLRRVAFLGDGRISIEPVQGQAGEREVGDPSHFVVYGVVVGRSRSN